MDYVPPKELVAEAVQAAEKKAALPVWDMVVRGVLAGVFLGYATSLVMVILAQGLPPLVGAAAFPSGFVIQALLGLELATGNFALLPLGVMGRRMRVSELFRNWWWVYLGNLMGSLLYAALFYLAVTNFGTTDGGAIGQEVRQIGEKKTLAYMAVGLSGWSTALVKGILCNWLVTVGTLMAFVSRSTVGKIAAIWLPIMIFFAHGYEHAVVNMYVIPSAILLGAPITAPEWWLWNQIPVTLGNIVAGVVLTGLPLHLTYSPASRSVTVPSVSLQRPDSAVAEEGEYRGRSG